MEEASGQNASGDQASGKAIASFVLGLLALMTFYACPLFAVLAIVFGMGEKEGLGRAGMILGWIGVAVYALGALIGILYLLVGGTMVAVDF